MSDWFNNTNGNMPNDETPPSSGTSQEQQAGGYTPAEPPVPPSGETGVGNPEPSGSVPQPPYNPQPGNYYSPGGYDPYGWQRVQTQPGPASPHNPPPHPPKKKKSAASILIALLAVVCAGTIITLSILLAVALNDVE